MAAPPPPSWKKKTRPCPFYSQGRCLFADACNFVHSVKVSHESPTAASGTDTGKETTRLDDASESAAVLLGVTTHDGDSSLAATTTEKKEDDDAILDNHMGEMSCGSGVSSRSSSSLCRTPSERRRRVVLMSPPRSPRLSGLLSVLEPLIGPDVEEIEISDEEEDGDFDGDGDEGDAPREGGAMLLDGVREGNMLLQSVSSPSAHSSQESTSLAYYLASSPAPSSKGHDSQLLFDQALPLSASSTPPNHPSDADVQPDFDISAPPAPTPPQGSVFRGRVPSRINTQDLGRDEHTTTILDNNTLEVHSHHRSSHQDHLQKDQTHPHPHRDQHHRDHQQQQHHLNHTDDPLPTSTSSSSRRSRAHSTFELLTSPFTVHRILSPTLFAVCDPTSPVFSASALQLHHHRLQEDNSGSGPRRPYAYADDDVDSLETLESSNDESFSESSSSLSRDSDSLLLRNGSDETALTVNTTTEDVVGAGSIGSACGSPDESDTERPSSSSEYSRTPRNKPRISIQSVAEVERLPPLPVSRAADRDEVEGELESLDSDQTPSHNQSSVVVERETFRESLSSPSRPSPVEEVPAPPESAVSDGGKVSRHQSPTSSPREEPISHFDGHPVNETKPQSPTVLQPRSSRSNDEGWEDVLEFHDRNGPETIPRLVPTLAVAEDSGECESSDIVHEGSEQAPRRQGSEELERQLPRVEENEPSSVLDDFIQEYPQNQDACETASPEHIDAAQTGLFPSASTLESSSMHFTPISTSQARTGSLDSPPSLSFGPSPISPDYGSPRSQEAMIEPGVAERTMHDTILERRGKHTSDGAKQLSVVSLTSPTKELRESFFPASLEKTVRPTPSPLYEGSQHSASDSASSSVVSSPRPSWAELQKRSGASNKVPFGFRQSLLAEESSSLARKLASQFSRDSSDSRASSTSSLSPTSASVFNPHRVSRVDMLSGRARSVSPGLVASPGSSSHRHSIASHSSSVPSVQAGPSCATLPRSASQAEFSANHLRSDSPVQLGDPGPSSSSARRASWMKPLRLSQAYSSASSHSRCSSSLSQNDRLSTASIHLSQAHVRNTSQGSVVQNTEPSSARSSFISAYLNESDNIPSNDERTIILGGEATMPSMESVLAGSNSPLVHHHSQSTGTTDHETGSPLDLLSPLSGSMRGLDFEELSRYQWPVETSHDSMSGDVTVTEDIPPNQLVPPTPASYRNTLIPPNSTEPISTNSSFTAPSHAIATPRPTLMFAIASDNPAEVERVLASGEARPNDVIGPQSALEFTMTNDALVNKTEIVKTLLAFGADVSALPNGLCVAHRDDQESTAAEREEAEDVLADLPSEKTDESISPKRKKRESVLNPAMKYYLNRATAGPQAAQTSAALRRSDFRSLARMRFDFIGQDRALEHLYWVLGMHSQQPIGTPLVVLCCGPCGHGKSLLARKFGSLLNVPTHTVNMTVLKTSHDLWECPSMSPYDPPSERTLAEFLEENAGKRCVVVLDEIDKNEDERTLWSLLAPWELGRCSIDAGRRHIDVRNVIWLGTSNIGQDLVFEHHATRLEPDTVMSKVEYRELMNILRPLVTERLGTSLMSRVTTVLPFVPFTHEEQLAIASEAILSLGGEDASELSPENFERLALQCVSEYIQSDGARSLYRSVSTHLMEVI